MESLCRKCNAFPPSKQNCRKRKRFRWGMEWNVALRGLRSKKFGRDNKHLVDSVEKILSGPRENFLPLLVTKVKFYSYRVQ